MHLTIKTNHRIVLRSISVVPEFFEKNSKNRSFKVRRKMARLVLVHSKYRKMYYRLHCPAK